MALAIQSFSENGAADWVVLFGMVIFLKRQVPLRGSWVRRTTFLIVQLATSMIFQAIILEEYTSFLATALPNILQIISTCLFTKRSRRGQVEKFQSHTTRKRNSVSGAVSGGARHEWLGRLSTAAGTMVSPIRWANPSNRRIQVCDEATAVESG